MSTSKLRAPEGFSSLTIEGRPVEVASDGSYHANHRDIATLRAHGFVDWHDHPGAGGDIETMTHEQLADAAAKRTREEAMKMDPERLRSALRAPGAVVEEADPSPAEVADAEQRLKSESARVDAPRIAAMNRTELFAYLKSHGVSAPPPITNDRLREIALDTLLRSAP